MEQDDQQEHNIMLEKDAVIEKENKEYLTEAYADFTDRLCFDYLIANDCTEFLQLQERLGMRPGNSSPFKNDFLRLQAQYCFCLIYPLIMWSIKEVFTVKANHFAMVIEYHKSGKRTRLYGPGYHILGYYNKLMGIYTFGESSYGTNTNVISSANGDLVIAKVEQGTIMHFECGGQNIILGPGIHKMSEPMRFVQSVRLDSFYIEIGPEKWVTVPDGYDGIAVNRGMIKVLKGGKQHHLAHAGEVFAKMVPKTIQTDRVPTDIPTYVKNLDYNREQRSTGFDPSQDLVTTTSEGSAVTLDAMIFWKITDTYLASQTVMEILSVDEGHGRNKRDQDTAIKAASRNIHTLRQNVLRIAKNHLTALVGSCTLAGMNDSANLQGTVNNAPKDQPRLAQNQAQYSAQPKPMYNSGPRVQMTHQPPQQVQPLHVNNIDQEPLEIDDEEQDENQNMLSGQDYDIPSESNNLNQMQIQQMEQAQEEEYPTEQAVEQQYNQNKNNFEILSVLQNNSKQLKDTINRDFVKIGVHLENICIFKVTPSADIQVELDRQTKARVDANTALINVLSKRESGLVEYEIQKTMSIEKARARAQVTHINSEAQADAIITEAKGQAESITILANSRQQEAQLLEEKEFAKVLAQLRAAGEAGQNIFQGNSNNFVFGNNPGDVIYGMFNKLAKK